jgi:hypothetical protein
MVDLQWTMHRIIRANFRMEIDFPRQAGLAPICIKGTLMLGLQQCFVDSSRKNVTLWQKFL